MTELVYSSSPASALHYDNPGEVAVTPNRPVNEGRLLVLVEGLPACNPIPLTRSVLKCRVDKRSVCTPLEAGLVDGLRLSTLQHALDAAGNRRQFLNLPERLLHQVAFIQSRPTLRQFGGEGSGDAPLG